MDDGFDLMPNDATSIYEAVLNDEQVQEENEERAMVLSAEPLLDSLLEWFDNEITLSDSIDGLDLESGVEIRAQILARQLLKSKLQSSRFRLQSFKDTYVK